MNKEEERRIVYCPKCGCIGSIINHENCPNCPDCGTLMMDTGFSKSTWDNMSQDEKDDFKNSIKPKTEAIAARNSNSIEEMADDIHTIKNWVSFFGIISVLGIIGGVFAILLDLSL